MSTTYTRPELYQLAFSYRDFEREVAFLAEVARRHGAGLGSFLEQACGPGDHSLAFAAQGIEVGALDASEEMIAHLREGARAAGVELEAVVGDMREVHAEFVGRFDLTATLIGSVDHLLTNADFSAHLGACSACLKPGGVAVLDMVHPKDVFGLATSTETVWRMERPGLSVEVQWGREDDPFDPIREVEQTTVTLSGAVDGEPFEPLVEVLPMRRFSLQTVLALLESSGAGLECVAAYGAFDLGVALDDADAWRMILVLKKA